MDLQTLTFKVETGALKEAATDLLKIHEAMAKLGPLFDKPVKKPKVDPKAVREDVESIAPAAENAGKGLSKVEKIIDKTQTTLEIMRNQSVRTADGFTQLSDGFTKSQAGTLAMMRQLGATTQQLEALAAAYENTNRIMGVNTFDNSASGVSKLRKQFQELSTVNKLMVEGLNLTKNQVVDLSREMIRAEDMIRAQSTLTGAALENLVTQVVNAKKHEFVELAKSVNQQVAISEAQQKLAKEEANAKIKAEKDITDAVKARLREEKKALDEIAAAKKSQERAEQAIVNAREHANLQAQYMQEGYGIGASSKAATMQMKGVSREVIQSYLDVRSASEKARKSALEMANATEYLEHVEKRLEHQLSETNRALGSEHSEELIRISEAIKKAGLNSEQAAAKMQKLDGMVRKVADKENEAKMRNLARAMSVQLGDVGISLASGQNPFIVMLQQGDQIRDAIARSGVEAAAMGKTMGLAFTQIADSAKMTGLAIGSFFVEAIKKAGTALGGFGLTMVNAKQTMAEYQIAAEIAASQGSRFASAFLSLSKYVTIGLGIFAALSVMIGVTLAVAFVKATFEHDKLVQSLTLANGALQLNTDSAKAYVSSLSKLGLNGSDVAEVISEMGKTGELTASKIGLVSKAAIDLNRFGGVAIKDTVKIFGDIAKEPLKAIEKLSKETGMVPKSILEMVRSLELQGKTFAAAEVGIAAYSNIVKSQVSEMKQEFTSFGLLVKETVELMNNAYDFAKNKLRGAFVKSNQQEELTKYIKQQEALKSILGLVGAWSDEQENNLVRAKQDLDLSERKVKLQEKEKDFKAIQKDLDKEAAEESTKHQSDAEKHMARMIFLANKLATTADATSRANWVKVIQAETDKYNKSINSQGDNGFSGWMKKFSNMAIEAKYAVDDLTKAEMAYKELLASPEYAKYSEGQRNRLKAEAQLAVLAQRKNVMDKLALEYAKELFDIEEKRREAWLAKYDQGKEALRSEKEQLSAAEDNLHVLGMTEESAKRYLKTLELQRWYKYEMAKIDADSSTEATDAEKALSRSQLTERYKTRMLTLNSEIALDAAKKTLQEFQNITQGISEAITTALIEGSQAGKKKMRDLIVAELRKKITVEINAYVNTAMDWLMGGSGNGTAGQAVATGNAFSNMSDKVGALYTAYKTGGLAGMFSGGSTAATAGTVSGGTGITMGGVSQGSAASASTTTGSSSAAGASAGSYALMAAAIYMAAKKSMSDVQEGWNRDAVDYSKSQTSGVERSLFNAYDLTSKYVVLSKLSDKLFGNNNWTDFMTATPAITKLFGWKAPQVTEAGLMGNVQGDKFNNGQSYQHVFAKGGLFRSDKNIDQFQTLDNGTNQFLQYSTENVVKTIKDMASTLGVGTDALKNFTYDFKVNLLGLTDDQALEAIIKEFAKMSDQMVGTIIDLKEYQRTGETATETLQRISSTLGLTNGMFKDLGWQVKQTSLAGYDAAESFAAMFGGVEQMTAALSTYYKDYYSVQEQNTRMTEKLSEAFTSLGVQMPTTKAGLRAMIEQFQALGDDQTVARLIQLSADFTGLIENTTAATADYSDLISQLLTLQGKTQELRQMELNKLDATGQALQLEIWALEDTKAAQDAYNASLAEAQKNLDAAREKVKQAETKVQGIRDRATEKYIAAQEAMAAATSRVQQVQQNLVNKYKDIGVQLRDFIAQAQSAGSSNLGEILTKAKAGDEKALSALPEAAQKAIDAARDMASTSAEADQAKAAILASVGEVASMMENYQGSSLEAQILSTNQELLDAYAAQTQASADLASALNTANQIGAALMQQPEDLISEFRVAMSELASARNYEAEMLTALQAIQAQVTATTQITGQSLAVGLVTASQATSTNLVSQAINSAIGTVGTTLTTANALTQTGNDSAAVTAGATTTTAAGVNTLIDDGRKTIQPPGGGGGMNDTTLTAMYASGGVFTNSIVRQPTEFNNSQMGESGPEAIMPLSTMSDGSLGVKMISSSNADLINEIRMLNARLADLEAASIATAQTNSKISKILDRVSPDGDSLQVVVV